jgi:hypothetical protein
MSGVLRPHREFGGGSGVRSPGGGSVLPVSPDTPAGLYGWWDDSGIVGGATPTAWNDRSGNSRNFTLTACLARTVGGINAIDFNGIASRGIGPFILPSASDFTIFVCYVADTLASRNWLISCSDNLNIEVGTGGLNNRFSSVTGVDLRVANPVLGEATVGAWSRGQPNALAISASATANVSASTAAAGAPVAISANTYIGIRESGLVFPFDGAIAEIVIYNRVLPPNEFFGVRAFLRERFP